jgi:hypothetical protein
MTRSTSDAPLEPLRSIGPRMVMPQQGLVVLYLRLRQTIGWVALLMPAAVRVGAYLFEGSIPPVRSTPSPSSGDCVRPNKGLLQRETIRDGTIDKASKGYPKLAPAS